MAMKCFSCGKGIMIGRQHKHHPGVAGGRWKRRAPKTLKVFKPNLHVAHIRVAGNLKKVKLCTKCLRIAKEAQKSVVDSKVVKTQPQITSSILSA